MESAVDLVRVVFSGVSALVIEDVTDDDELIEGKHDRPVEVRWNPMTKWAD